MYEKSYVVSYEIRRIEKNYIHLDANNIEGAVKKQTSDLSQASILQHFSVSGAGFNTKVQIIDDNVDVNFVIADE